MKKEKEVAKEVGKGVRERKKSKCPGISVPLRQRVE